jgi:hypothetical protein
MGMLVVTASPLASELLLVPVNSALLGSGALAELCHGLYTT